MTIYETIHILSKAFKTRIMLSTNHKTYIGQTKTLNNLTLCGKFTAILFGMNDIGSSVKNKVATSLIEDT